MKRILSTVVAIVLTAATAGVTVAMADGGTAPPGGWSTPTVTNTSN